MNTPTESEVRQEILAAALRQAPSGDGYTLRELRALTDGKLSANKAREGLRELITAGKVVPVTVYRRDLGNRLSPVVGYRFV